MIKSISLMSNEELIKEYKREKENLRTIMNMCLHFGNLGYKRNSIYKKSEKRIEDLEEEMNKRGVKCL